jgi:hypothetical protein
MPTVKLRAGNRERGVHGVEAADVGDIAAHGFWRCTTARLRCSLITDRRAHVPWPGSIESPAKARRGEEDLYLSCRQAPPLHP